MEKQTYHAHLQALREHFPGVEMIPVKDAAAYVGCDPRTLKADRSFPIKKLGRFYSVSLINLARWLAV